MNVKQNTKNWSLLRYLWFSLRLHSILSKKDCSGNTHTRAHAHTHTLDQPWFRLNKTKSSNQQTIVGYLFLFSFFLTSPSLFYWHVLLFFPSSLCYYVYFIRHWLLLIEKTDEEEKEKPANGNVQSSSRIIFSLMQTYQVWECERERDRTNLSFCFVRTSFFFFNFLFCLFWETLESHRERTK